MFSSVLGFSILKFIPLGDYFVFEESVALENYSHFREYIRI
jgi:hypothetical protein